MKLYIAGPMSGLPEFNYPAFNTAAEHLLKAGYYVLNPADIDFLHNAKGQAKTWDWYMRHAIKMVLQAEGVALLDGWRDSKGASLEFTIARALELDIRTLDAWLARIPQSDGAS